MKLKKRIMTTTVSLIAVTAAVVGALAVPAVLRIGKLKSEYVKEQSRIQQRYELRSYVKEASADLEAAQSRLVAIRRTFIEQNGELDFIQTMEDLATKSGVKQELNLLMANEKEITPWEKEIPVSLQASGSFADLLKWLKGIERLPYALSVESVSLAPEGSTERQAGKTVTGEILRATVSGKIPWVSSDAPYFKGINPPPTEEIPSGEMDEDEPEEKLISPNGD